VWITLTRYYNEVALLGKRYLRDFAYIIPILKNEAIDWDVVLSANRSYELHAPLFYYLNFLRSLGACVPEAVLAETSPLRSERLRDFGWQLGKLFDVLEPSPSPETSSAAK
jgi:hypothetical protein